jgi:hypothetical protein
LAKNSLATESILYIYCDGFKKNISKEEINCIIETREIANRENRFKKVIVKISEKNKGLASSIIEGVTEVVNESGKVIVLEDDIVTSTGFLSYMNEALNIYENDNKVMHISGYMYPIKHKSQGTFFIKPTSCWGWATWKSSWRFFEKDVHKQINEIEIRNAWSEFTLNNACNSFKDQLYLNKEGLLNTWAIFWQTSVFLNNGLSLHPYPSLVQNIGLDGTGVNCEKMDFNPFHWEILAESVDVKKIKIKKNIKLTRKLEFFFNSFTKSKKINLRDRFYLLRKKIF